MLDCSSLPVHASRLGKLIQGPPASPSAAGFARCGLEINVEAHLAGQHPTPEARVGSPAGYDLDRGNYLSNSFSSNLYRTSIARSHTIQRNHCCPHCLQRANGQLYLLLHIIWQTCNNRNRPIAAPCCSFMSTVQTLYGTDISISTLPFQLTPLKLAVQTQEWFRAIA